MEGISIALEGKILAAGSSGGHTMSLIEDPQGSFSISVDGCAVLDYHWPPDQLDRCMALFLGMLRHHGVSH